MTTLREAAENAVGLLCDCETTDLGKHATDCTAWELHHALASQPDTPQSGADES